MYLEALKGHANIIQLLGFMSAENDRDIYLVFNYCGSLNFVTRPYSHMHTWHARTNEYMLIRWFDIWQENTFTFDEKIRIMSRTRERKKKKKQQDKQTNSIVKSHLPSNAHYRNRFACSGASKHPGGYTQTIHCLPAPQSTQVYAFSRATSSGYQAK